MLRTTMNNKKHSKLSYQEDTHRAMTSFLLGMIRLVRKHVGTSLTSISFLQVLLKMLPKYYDHVKEHENTLITKFFGLHRITINGRSKVSTLCYMTFILFSARRVGWLLS